MNTMAMSVFERRGEIVTLRAMGWRKWRIARMIVSEAMLLSIVGTDLGVALGVGMTFVLVALAQNVGADSGRYLAAGDLRGERWWPRRLLWPGQRFRRGGVLDCRLPIRCVVGLTCHSPELRRNLSHHALARTIGSFDRNKFVPWNQPWGSTKATWYSMKIAPAGSASLVALA